jgi:hypothetical protein
MVLLILMAALTVSEILGALVKAGVLPQGWGGILAIVATVLKSLGAKDVDGQ